VLLNQPRAMTWLDECGLDAIVATSWVNVLYCSDYYLWLQPVFKEYMERPGATAEPPPLFAVLSRHGSSALILDQCWELNATECWITNRYVFGSPNTPSTACLTDGLTSSHGFVRSPHRFHSAIDALGALFRTEQLADARIGFEMESLSPTRQAEIRAAFPRSQLRDASNLLRLIRMVKSDDELCRLRRAAEINLQAAVESLALARPGCQMQDLVQVFRTSVAAAGAEFDHFAFSQRGIGFATENQYCLPEREAMFVDFGCVYRHYYSDAGTTLFLGRPTDRERTAYDVLTDCLNEAANGLQPGVKASLIQAGMQRRFEEGSLMGCFPHGHGIGIEVRDYPILVPDSGRLISDECITVPADLTLETGMVINLEAPVLDWGGTALQLEQSYIVTPAGGEPLVRRDLSQPCLAVGVCGH
jgi:Xaa-Pro dipeptidase